jgi:hypothetical protein
MLLLCLGVQAVFPGEALGLASDGPAQMLWDEHGGTFVLRVGDLKLMDPPEPGVEPGISLELALSPPEPLLEKIRGFAGKHNLPLTPKASPPPELTGRPLLAACHIPEKSLFIFCEEPELQGRSTAAQTMELTVTGSFRARRVPCRETDLVIHLTGPAMAQLLSYLFALIQSQA